MAISTNTSIITKSFDEDGKPYYTTIRKGVKYCAYMSIVAGQWFVSTRRLALSCNFGGGKYYKSIEDCKAFAALPTLIKTGAI